MAWRDYEVDGESYGEKWAKVYFDFDTVDEAEQFAEWANGFHGQNAMQRLMDEFEKKENMSASKGVFELVEETREQVVVKVNADDPLTVARHPYVSSDMAYITVTRGSENTYTIVKNDGRTWSFHMGKRSVEMVSENTHRLRHELDSFLLDERVFLDVETDYKPYAADFYEYKGHWWVDFAFSDTNKRGRAYFPLYYATPKDLVEKAFVDYNDMFAGRGDFVESKPNGNVGTVYRVEIDLL